MYSEEEKELEEKLEKNFEDAIQFLSKRDDIAQWSLLNKILFYIFIRK